MEILVKLFLIIFFKNVSFRIYLPSNISLTNSKSFTPSGDWTRICSLVTSAQFSPIPESFVCGKCPAVGWRGRVALTGLWPTLNPNTIDGHGECWESWKETSGPWPLTLRGNCVTRTKPRTRRTGRPCLSANRRRTIIDWLVNRRTQTWERSGILPCPGLGFCTSTNMLISQHNKYVEADSSFQINQMSISSCFKQVI